MGILCAEFNYSEQFHFQNNKYLLTSYYDPDICTKYCENGVKKKGAQTLPLALRGRKLNKK